MILLCKKTWSKKDGRQKIHYSQQGLGKRTGAHSATIRSAEFMRFYEAIRDSAPDIMLEVKDKNLSAVKCILLTDEEPERKRLEEEWGRYKYLIMERAPEIYTEIRSLFSGGETVRAMDFYVLAEDALSREADPGRAENAALHVWGYFSDQATEQEKKMLFVRLNAYRDQRGSLAAVKGHLLRMAERYGEDYLLNSLYFYL
jgi:UV DNA damage endonuclease